MLVAQIAGTVEFAACQNLRLGSEQEAHESEALFYGMKFNLQLQQRARSVMACRSSGKQIAAALQHKAFGTCELRGMRNF